MTSLNQSIMNGKMNTPTTKEEYLEWYVKKFKHSHISVVRLTEEASVSYQCLKRVEELEAEQKNLESLKEEYLMSFESFARIRIMGKAYEVLNSSTIDSYVDK